MVYSGKSCIITEILHFCDNFFSSEREPYCSKMKLLTVLQCIYDCKEITTINQLYLLSKYRMKSSTLLSCFLSLKLNYSSWNVKEDDLKVSRENVCNYGVCNSRFLYCNICKKTVFFTQWSVLFVYHSQIDGPAPRKGRGTDEVEFYN